MTDARVATFRGRAVWLGTAAVVATGDALVAWHHAVGAPHGYPFWLETTLGASFSGALAGLLMERRPGHPVGRLAFGLGTASALQLIGGAVASTATATTLPRWLAVGAAYLSAVGQSAILAGLALVLVLVPTGRPLSPRWRPVCWAPVLTVAGMSVADMLDRHLGGAAYLSDNPLARHGGSTLRLAGENVGGGVALIVALAGVAALAVRYRRSAGDERQQMKWIVAAGIAGLALILVAALGSAVVAAPQQVGSIVWAGAGSAVPAATTAAILRYRLYDIDRVVSRTVSYAIVTGAIVGLYVGAVALADRVLGFSSNVAVAASTLAAAAAFQPLRRRVQHAVDRRFDRAAYDARRVADAFSLRLRNAVDVDRVTGDLLSTVATAVAPANASVWLVTQ